MKNLWLLLSKYNAFFLFVLFFGISFYLLVQNNSFQRASSINSSSMVVGTLYERVSAWKNFLSLREANTELAEENASLRRQLQMLIQGDSTLKEVVLDSLGEAQYSYLVANVINNSINQKNNYLTINKGYADGVRKGMGVISPNGVVGIVLNVSTHFATIQSVLHSDTRISAALEHSEAFGSLVWGDNIDARYGMLRDIPNHVEVEVGERVYTSGFSLFPPGIQVGTVFETGLAGGESFLDIKVELSTNFHNIQHVYVVLDSFVDEREQLEDSTQNDG